MPPRRGRKKARPRYLPGCQVLFLQDGGDLVSGKVEEVVSLQGPTYQIQCSSTGRSLQLDQSKLQFAVDTPVWIQTKSGKSMPGMVVNRANSAGHYSIKMMADNKVVAGIVETMLQYNSLQVAIQVDVATALVKQEALEEEQEQLSAAASDAIARPAIVVKQEPGLEENQEPAAAEDSTIYSEGGRVEQNNEVPVNNNTASPNDSEGESDDPEDSSAYLEEQLLQKRRNNRRRGHVLNETPNQFYSIVCSPKHNVKEALQLIRDYIEKYGNAARNGNRPFGGLGPVLYQRCLHWHLRGECRRSHCKFGNDHGALTMSEALAIEGALEPAMSPKGPIYPPEVILEDQESDKEDQSSQLQPVEEPTALVPAVPVDPRPRRKQPTVTPAALAATATADAQPEKRRRFECPEQIKLLVPFVFGDSFYRNALSTPKAKAIRDQYSCQWDLCVQPMSVIIQGDDYDQMERSKEEIPRLLCMRLPLGLRGKMLWDLNRLRTQTDQPFVTVPPHFLQPDNTCYMTIIPLGETFVPNQTICVEDAPGIADRLSLTYGPRPGFPKCHIGVHMAEKSQTFSTVPSHVILWSEGQFIVAKCRTDFFNQASTSQEDEDECW